MDSFEKPYWSLRQVIAWVVLRDPGLVRRASDEATYDENPAGPLNELEFDLRHTWAELLEGTPAHPRSKDAAEAILAESQSGHLSVYGRKNNSGDLTKIEQFELHLLRIIWDRYDTPYLATKDLTRHNATTWSDVTFERSEVLTIWPATTGTADAPDEPLTTEDEPADHSAEDDAADLQANEGHSTVGAETRCRKWLASLMSDGKFPQKSKPAYRAEAKAEFKTGTKAFDRAWGNAIADTGNAAWSKSGPKSKGSNS